MRAVGQGSLDAPMLIAQGDFEVEDFLPRCIEIENGPVR